MKNTFSARKQHIQKYLDQFVKHVQSLNELDYGDFMREANMDILMLKAALKRESQAVHDKLYEMQFYTQFRPSWEVEPTRSRLLRDVEVIKKLLH